MRRPKGQKNSHETTKNPCFSQLFGHPFWIPKTLRIIFRSPPKNTEWWKMGRKLRTQKSENPIYPYFLMEKKEELIRGPGGAFLLIELGRRRRFRTLFFVGPVSKVECTNAIFYYKIRVSAVFGRPKMTANLAIWRVNKRPCQELTSGPLNSGLFWAGYVGPLVNSSPGLWLTLEVLRSAEPSALLVTTGPLINT